MRISWHAVESRGVVSERNTYTRSSPLPPKRSSLPYGKELILRRDSPSSGSYRRTAPHDRATGIHVCAMMVRVWPVADAAAFRAHGQSQHRHRLAQKFRKLIRDALVE
jgi:hypothetical protein